MKYIINRILKCKEKKTPNHYLEHASVLFYLEHEIRDKICFIKTKFGKKKVKDRCLRNQKIVMR